MTSLGGIWKVRSLQPGQTGLQAVSFWSFFQSEVIATLPRLHAECAAKQLNAFKTGTRKPFRFAP